jgi:outer membrane murein-binding lipoprotein Lpp
MRTNSTGSRVRGAVEKCIGPLILAVILGAVCLTGCGCTTASPERQAHRAVATTITTANAAIDVWFAYVQQEERTLETLKTSDPESFMARRRALVINEGKVASAWDTYVAVQRSLILGAAALGPGEAPSPAEAKRLETELIALVQSLTR